MIQIDMPMSDNCVECRFNVSEFGYCNATPVNFCGKVNDCEEDGKPEWCPLKAQEPITGETSDGYHTFNELYHYRAVLFSVIVANYKDRAWKSVRHHDGTMYDGMFIVGIDTPDGQATYHYDIKCRVREFAPEWDGHTPAQAIERIVKLKAQEPVKPKYDPDDDDWAHCGHCGARLYERWVGANYCAFCGRAVKWDG